MHQKMMQIAVACFEKLALGYRSRGTSRTATILQPDFFGPSRERKVAMSADGENVAQDYLILIFPMKFAEDYAEIQMKLASLTADLREGADAVGTLHDCSFVVLDQRVIYMLADFDGSLDVVLAGIAAHLGRVINPLLPFVTEAPPTPIANHAGAFVQWAKANHLGAVVDYISNRGTTTRQIRSLAAAVDIELDAENVWPRPQHVVMQMKSRVSPLSVRIAVEMLTRSLAQGADEVGVLHFAHLVRLPGNRVGFFAVRDGPSARYAQDFADRLGPAFDLIFRFTKRPPPSPASRNAQHLRKWLEKSELTPLAFYSAYPGLQVQDIKALLADT
jgi:hypothetical protein